MTEPVTKEEWGEEGEHLLFIGPPVNLFFLSVTDRKEVKLLTIYGLFDTPAAQIDKN